MQVLINPVNGLVLLSSVRPIEIDEDRDAFVSGDHVILDPRPSSGVTVQDIPFPEESFCEYRMENGQPVRIVPVKPVDKSLVPKEVTRRQGLQQLLLEGVTEADIEAYIDSLPIPEMQRHLAVIELRASQVFERNRPLVKMLASGMLGKDEAQTDLMFIAASKL